MVEIRLSITYLAQYEQLIASAITHAVSAFLPFGIRFIPYMGLKLDTDPALTSNGWNELISSLIDISKAVSPPSPAHLVITHIPKNFDLSINGQLLERTRGICAVFLGARSFQTPNPETRIDLVTQVVIHELGHLMNLRHGDNENAEYASIMLPSDDRFKQTPADAWRDAIADAKNRGEPELIKPIPTYSYPFNATCRACLRQAEKNIGWLPWRSEFRDGFDEPIELEDYSLKTSLITADEEVITSAVGDGLSFTLEFENQSTQAIQIPTHIGPEYGTLRIEIDQNIDIKEQFITDGFRCSGAIQAILPGEKIYKSFSLISNPQTPLFAKPGNHKCKIKMLSHQGFQFLNLGAAEIDIIVNPNAAKYKAARHAAARVVASHRAGLIDAVSAKDVIRIRNSTLDSPILHHALYKLASATKNESDRKIQLNECLQNHMPIAIRHRAARRLAIDMLFKGVPFKNISDDFRLRLNDKLDTEFHESLKRMGEGWNTLNCP